MVRRKLESPSVLSILYVDTVLVFLDILITLSLMLFHSENFTEAINASIGLAIGIRKVECHAVDIEEEVVD